MMQKLLDIMKELRKFCPWDKEQDLDSLKRFAVEEVYELIEAIDTKDNMLIKEELGDLLLQVVFISTILEENNAFNFNDVVNSISDKLIRRHPHVFKNKNSNIKNAKQVEEQWENIKVNKENKLSIIDGVPKTMPSTLQAYRISEKASRLGFDWNNYKEVIAKIYEEINELEAAINSNNKIEIENELGDILFAVSNLARKLNINPEEAQKKTINTFKLRFNKMIELASLKNINFKDLSFEEKEKFWQIAKENLLKVEGDL